MGRTPLTTTSLLREAFALRRRVFCGEQGVAEAAEFDGLDGGAVHLVVVTDGETVATCRLLAERGALRVGRMAVDPRTRRRGVGRAMLAEAERVAGVIGARRLTLHAQVAAESFYAGAGYRRRGEPFIEERIEHVVMEKALA